MGSQPLNSTSSPSRGILTQPANATRERHKHHMTNSDPQFPATGISQNLPSETGRKLVILSTAQNSTEELVLQLSKTLGITTSGFMPKGFRTPRGPRPDLAEQYGLREVASAYYPATRAILISRSDCSIHLGHPDHRQTKKRADLARMQARPFLQIGPSQPVPEAAFALVEFLSARRLPLTRSLAIAITAERDELAPDLPAFAAQVLHPTLALLSAVQKAQI
jgi:hypothetical protein